MPHGVHRDADKHRADALARYYRLRDDPDFHLRKRAAQRRYRLRCWKRAEGEPRNIVRQVRPQERAA